MIVEQLVYADNLTDAEQRIADYILEHPEAVPEMSVHALSGAVHCAPSAIVRFCQKLGCGGYRQFCREPASDLERRRAHGSLVDVDRPFASGQGPREVAGSIASVMHRSIDICSQELDVDVMEAIARDILGVQNVYLYGVGESLIMLNLFSNLMIKLGVNCTVVDRYGERVATTMAAKPGDVAIVVSYTGRTLAFAHLEECLAILHDRQCRTAIISSIEAGPEFDYRLRIPPLEDEMQTISNFYSLTSIAYALFSIYGLVFAYLHEVKERMDRELPELMAGLSTSFSAERYLEFNPRGVDKGTGLADVANYLGVPMEETIGVGDSANDLGMLVGPNLGLVVANVSDTIADQVPNVLESECEDAALMEVYERYIAPDLAG